MKRFVLSLPFTPFHSLSLLFFLLFHFSFSNPAQAQITHASQGRLDENATAALQKAARRMDNVRCTVTRTALDANKKQLAKQSATVRYCRGKYRLEFDGQEIISDGTTVWHWNKAAKEVTISTVGDDDMDLLNPARLVANYDKNFRAKYIRTDDDGTAVIDLQPRSAQSYHKLRLFVAEKDGTLRRIEMHKYDSGREIYDFSGHKFSLPVGSYSFDPKAHPDVEVIDMR